MPEIVPEEEVPAISAVDIETWAACIGQPVSEACDAAMETFNLGTGCNAQCQADFDSVDVRTAMACASQPPEECRGTFVPCDAVALPDDVPEGASGPTPALGPASAEPPGPSNSTEGPSNSTERTGTPRSPCTI